MVYTQNQYNTEYQLYFSSKEGFSILGSLFWAFFLPSLGPTIPHSPGSSIVAFKNVFFTFSSPQ